MKPSTPIACIAKSTRRAFKDARSCNEKACQTTVDQAICCVIYLVWHMHRTSHPEPHSAASFVVLYI